MGLQRSVKDKLFFLLGKGEIWSSICFSLLSFIGNVAHCPLGYPMCCVYGLRRGRSQSVVGHLKVSMDCDANWPMFPSFPIKDDNSLWGQNRNDKGTGTNGTATIAKTKYFQNKKSPQSALNFVSIKTGGVTEWSLVLWNETVFLKCGDSLKAPDYVMESPVLGLIPISHSGYGFNFRLHNRPPGHPFTLQLIPPSIDFFWLECHIFI